MKQYNAGFHGRLVNC